MVYKAEDYTEILKKLLPPGMVWMREEGNNLDKLLAGIAEEAERVDNRIDDLLDEALPSATIEMMEDWQRVAGLPDT